MMKGVDTCPMVMKNSPEEKLEDELREMKRHMPEVKDDDTILD